MILFTSLLFFFTTTIFANPLPSECDFLTVNLSNNSPYTCILSNKNNIKGTILKNKIPNTLATNSDNFFTTQDITGIELNLTYNCENNMISFAINRSPITFSAQPIKFNYSTSEKTNVSYSSHPGSCWWGNRAQLNIQIE